MRGDNCIQIMTPFPWWSEQTKGLSERPVHSGKSGKGLLNNVPRTKLLGISQVRKTGRVSQEEHPVWTKAQKWEFMCFVWVPRRRAVQLRQRASRRAECSYTLRVEDVFQGAVLTEKSKNGGVGTVQGDHHATATQTTEKPWKPKI